MAKTFLDLKNAVAAALGRNKTDFTFFTTEDTLVRSINNAKDYVQREMDFELAKTFAQVANVTTGGDLANAKLYGTSTAVVVKNVRKAFAIDRDTGELEIMTRDAFIEMSRRRDNSLSYGGYFVRHGQLFYIYPTLSSAKTIYMDIHQWLPDMSADADTSFLLDYCFDLLQYRSILELNFFLKEDQRIPVSAQLLESLWESVKRWNNTLIYNSTVDVNLD